MTTRTLRIPWNTREFRRRTRIIPRTRPELVINADVHGSTGRYDETALETARYWEAVRKALERDPRR